MNPFHDNLETISPQSLLRKYSKQPKYRLNLRAGIEKCDYLIHVRNKLL